MIRIYLAALCGGAIFFAYVMGVHVGNIKCDARIANTNSEQLVLNTTIMEQTNEMVFHTGTSDIRRILRANYTIAE